MPPALRIHVLAVGSTGDVLPLAWLASALVQRGHEVHLLAPEPFAPLAQRLGLNFVPILDTATYQQVQQHPALWNPVRHFHLLWPMFQEAAQRSVEWLAAEREAGRPAVLVAHSLAFGARVARDRWGWPQATVHVSPCWLWSRHAPPLFHGLGWLPHLPVRWRSAVRAATERAFISSACLPALNRLRAGLGLKPVKRLLGPWMHSPDVTLGLFPDWLAPPQPDWPASAHLVGFPARGLPGEAALPGPVADFLAAGPAPLVFLRASLKEGAAPNAATAAWVRWALEVGALAGRPVLLLGLAPGEGGDEVAKLLADAAKAAGNDAEGAEAAATEHGATAGSSLARAQSPTCARALAWPAVPLEQVLPQAAALLCHGGIGSIRLALAAGCPMLLSAQAGDHFDNLARAVALGVALELPAGADASGASAPRTARLLAQLLNSPEVVAACRLAQQRSAQAPDALALACEAVEALAERRAEALR